MKYLNILWENAFAFLLFACVFVSSQETEEVVHFDYGQASGKGPSSWGTLRPDWSTCSSGKQQSPIDITIKTAVNSPNLGDLKQTYTSSAAVIKNRLHNLALIWKGDAGKITINETDYKVVQCHWHHPSEHTFDGASKDLELHLVHQTAQNQTAVVAIFFQTGEADPFLSKLMASIKSVGQGENDVGNVNPMDIGFVGKKYIRYIGSLTTPPCTEGVVWTILPEIKTISAEQLQALKDPLPKDCKRNVRPVQPLGERSILLYDPAGAGASAPSGASAAAPAGAGAAAPAGSGAASGAGAAAGAGAGAAAAAGASAAALK